MKRFLKISSVLFLLTVTLAFFSVSVFASEAEYKDKKETQDVTATDEDIENNSSISSPVHSDSTVDEEGSAPPDGDLGIIDDEGEEELENVFETAYNILMENADKIFSLLAFGASIIIALLYKKSFMPSIKNSMKSLSSALKGFSEENQKEIHGAGKLIESVNTRITETEGLLSALTKELEEIRYALDDKKGDSERLELIRRVMSAEVDMLYDIFMSSSLPQFKKEEVGERIGNMKKELVVNESVE